MPGSCGTVKCSETSHNYRLVCQAGVGCIGTQESTFNKILGLSSLDHLRMVFEKYSERREGAKFEEDLESEFSGALLTGFTAICMFIITLIIYTCV